MLPINSKGKTFEIFEFLVNFDLVDEYLDSENADDLACELIIQLLYAAFLSEQKSKQRTSKSENPKDQCDRVKAFGLLAMKAASVIEWDLATMEDRIPAVAIEDLLNVFINQYFRSERNVYSVDLDSTPDYVTFAIQLLCRWHVRAVIKSKFKRKDDFIPTTSTISNEPLKHMIQANKKALFKLSVNVNYAVQALERCYLVLRDLIRPVSACFVHSQTDSPSIEIHWDKGVSYPKTELIAHVAFDLGFYYFVNKRFSEASAFLNNALELSKRCTSKSCKNYFRDAESFAVVSSAFVASNQRKLSLSEKLDIRRHDLLITLLDDNITRSLSIEERFKLEQLPELTPSQVEIVHACNIVYSWIYSDFPLRIPRNGMTELLKKVIQHGLLHFKSNERIKLMADLYNSVNATDTTTMECSDANLTSNLIHEDTLMAYEEDDSPSYVKLDKVFTCKDTKDLLFLMSQMSKSELADATSLLLKKVPLPSFIVESLTNVDSQISTYIIALIVRAHKMRVQKHYERTQHFLSCSLAFLDDFARIRKFVQCEILFCEITQYMENLSSSKVDEDLIRRVMGFLNNLPRETDASAHVIRISLAFMVTLGHWSFVLNLRRLGYALPTLEVAITIAKILISSNQSDARQISNKTKEIEKVINWLNNTDQQDDSNNQCRDEFVELCVLLKNEQALNTIISLLIKFCKIGQDIPFSNVDCQLSRTKLNTALLNNEDVSRCLSQIIKHSLMLTTTFNSNRLILYSDLLANQMGMDKSFAAYKQLVLLLTYHTLDEENSDVSIIVKRLFDLAMKCKRYFEASFWAQYMEKDDNYLRIYQEIICEGNLDSAKLIVPYINDISLLEFLAAAMAEQGSVPLWTALSQQMQSINNDRCNNESGKLSPSTTDEISLSWTHGTLTILQIVLSLDTIFEGE
ncbi:hypothetical protein GJ496_012035 [Pomphorhynchus laevis]|nr:hypothetical protein GJ496_012035 [Pomphorhynchus laevis]